MAPLCTQEEYVWTECAEHPLASAGGHVVVGLQED